MDNSCCVTFIYIVDDVIYGIGTDKAVYKKMMSGTYVKIVNSDKVKVKQIIVLNNILYGLGEDSKVYQAATGTDAIIILTEWAQFKQIDWSNVSNVMRKPSWLFDTRSICNIKEAKSSGLNVWSIGKGK